VHAKSVDFAGHESGAAVGIVVDNSGPLMLLSSPKGQKSGLVSFAVNVTDTSQVSRVQVNIDGTGWRDLLLEPSGYYVYRWPTTSPQNGEHTYSLVSQDGLGNTAVITGHFNVKNEPDYWRITLESMPLVAFFFVIILVIAVLAMVRYGRLQAWIRQDVKKEPGLFSLRKKEKGDKASPSAKGPAGAVTQKPAKIVKDAEELPVLEEVNDEESVKPAAEEKGPPEDIMDSVETMKVDGSEEKQVLPKKLKTKTKGKGIMKEVEEDLGRLEEKK
jgi:hypothetical protein